MGVASFVDRGVEDTGKSKANKYAGKLGRHKEYLNSSNYQSYNSVMGLDVDAIRVVGLHRKRKGKKVRYDKDCEVFVFEFGMFYEGAKQFRKVIADYVVEYKRLKLKPNKKYRVRVKCKIFNWK